MRATWPEFLPLLEEEALADANVPYLDWLAAAAGRRRDDPAWLLDRYDAAGRSAGDRAERFDSLGFRSPGISATGRGLAHADAACREPRPFFHDAPLLARRDVSLDAVMSGPPLALRRLPRREGERICDLVREATAARYREFYTFTYADPTSVVAARPGRGVELFLVGVRPERRLPLRAAYGGFVVKNGVPIGYIEGLAFFERLEIGFNMYYTFREGESAWIYAQVLKLHRDALGVTSFSIDPYQLGYENEEAIDVGRLLVLPQARLPADERERRGALVDARGGAASRADPGHRSSRATLGALVDAQPDLRAPGTVAGAWDRFHVRNLGLAVNRRMRRAFGGDAARLRGERPRVASRGRSGLRPDALAARAGGSSGTSRSSLDLVPGLSRWASAEKAAVVEIVRAKAAASREELPAPPAEAREAAGGAAPSRVPLGVASGALVSRGDDLGEDREGDLFRRAAAEVAGRSARGAGRARRPGARPRQPRPPLLLGAPASRARRRRTPGRGGPSGARGRRAWDRGEDGDRGRAVGRERARAPCPASR